MPSGARFHDPIIQVLPPAAARRLSNQIARAYRGTYGAKTGLRTIVRGITSQMLASGASSLEIVDLLERFVVEHPACLANNPRNIVTGQSYSETLTALIRESVADVAPARASS